MEKMSSGWPHVLERNFLFFPFSWLWKQNWILTVLKFDVRGSWKSLNFIIVTVMWKFVSFDAQNIEHDMVKYHGNESVKGTWKFSECRGKGLEDCGHSVSFQTLHGQNWFRSTIDSVVVKSVTQNLLLLWTRHWTITHWLCREACLRITGFGRGVIHLYQLCTLQDDNWWCFN